MRYRGQNRRKNGNSADFPLKKRSLKGHIGTENHEKYHKSRLFAEKQNGIDGSTEPKMTAEGREIER